MKQLIAELDYNSRINHGKADEEFIVGILRQNGIYLEPVTEQQDMIDKIDRVFSSNGETVQIKGRDNNSEKAHIYKDFLVDVYEPFCGLTTRFAQYTKIGRDHVSKYDRFGCHIQDRVYFVNGKAQRELVHNALEAWKQSEEFALLEQQLERWFANNMIIKDGSPAWNRMTNSEFTIRYFANLPRFFYPINGYSVEVRCTRDRKNRRPKLLVFIPPQVYTVDQMEYFAC